MELSGLQTTNKLSPMVSMLSWDLLWEMMGTHGLAYQMMILSRVMLAIKILSKVASNTTYLSNWIDFLYIMKHSLTSMKRKSHREERSKTRATAMADQNLADSKRENLVFTKKMVLISLSTCSCDHSVQSYQLTNIQNNCFPVSISGNADGRGRGNLKTFFIH